MKIRSIEIDTFIVGEDSRSFLISEIGNNHNGSVERAKKLALLSKQAGADAVKFQMRDLNSIYPSLTKTDSEDLSSQYIIDLLKKHNLSPTELFEVFDYCKEIGILPLCTPWDLVSLSHLANYKIAAYKIASADLTNHQLIKEIIKLKKPILLSTGMSTEEEILKTVDLLDQHRAEYVLLYCNSTYPTPSKDIQLRYLSRLKEIGSGLIGYSGHERGIHIPLAAAVLGAKVIEKHFTDDKSLDGNDHKISLLPEEFKQMVSNIRETENALFKKGPKKVSQGEKINRDSLSKSVTAKKKISKGEVFTIENLEIKSPGHGLAPYYLDQLLGEKATRNIKKNSALFEQDLLKKEEINTIFSFNRPWGIPVRYHDIANLSLKTNANLLELHLSNSDIRLDQKDYLEGLDLQRFGFVVHAPELFDGDFLLDLTSPVQEVRTQSIDNLQGVINLTLSLKKYFPKTKKPLIIVNVGGFTSNKKLSFEEIQLRYQYLEESLGLLCVEGVEIVAQTMPPFPWHFGGQQFHNVFLDPVQIARFCNKNKMRICLDISHSKLACNYFGWDWEEYINTVGPYVAHLHISDASGFDGEGLQIGEGEIDFQDLIKILDKKTPDSSFIPEVWQGHVNEGEGFWVALNKLNKLF